MAQSLGMQMPGKRRPRPTAPNVYTGLMLASVACLLTAIVIVAMAATKVGPGDKGAMGMFQVHEEGRVSLKD
jgi:hypothetical protein